MKNPLKISKKVYWSTLQTPRLISIMEEQNRQLANAQRQIAELSRQIDGLNNHLSDIDSRLTDRQRYTNKLQQLYFDSLYRHIAGQPDSTGFYRELPHATGALRTYQLGCKKLLDVLVNICEQNNLTYWFQSGSLLGAVRHGGFVPWDDDLDVGMMRDNIIKLRKLLSSNSTYKVTLFYDYYCSSRQIRFRTTDPDNPCFLDIYIYDWGQDTSQSAWQSWHKQKEEIRRRIEDKLGPGLVDQWHQQGVVEDNTPLGQKIKIVFDEFYPTRGTKYSKTNCNVIWQLDNFAVEWRRLFDYNFIFPLVDLDFEGNKYKCPHEYQAYLERQYGDINSLPIDIVTHFSHIDKTHINTDAIEEFLRS